MGAFSICSELLKYNISSEILHLGVELEINKNFSISTYITHNDYKVILFPLHWYHQLYDTIEIARKIKNETPNVKIILGGYTASSFAKELMERFEFIDYIIKGEGEKPIIELVKYTLNENNKQIYKIPNIVYRKNNEILFSSKVWVANNKELNSFNFCEIENLRNYKKYIEITNNIFFTCVGRGCPGNCAWCGAGKNALKKITCRKNVSVRKSEIIANDIINQYKKYGLSQYINFDPYPKKQDYIIKIFEKVGEMFPKQVKITFDCYGLPTKKLIDAMKKNLSESSCFVVSPDFADEKLRKKYNTHKFTNKQLFKTLDYIEEKQVGFCIYFAQFPNEEYSETIERKRMIEFIRNKYKMAGDINIIPINYFPPFAPISINPSKYNIKLPVLAFEDYYKISEGLKFI